MKVIPHSFTQYELTEEENKAGHLFTESNRGIIQNMISEAANARIALTLDPQNINAFVQAEAYLKGKIDALQYLLEMHKYVQDQTQQSGE